MRMIHISITWTGSVRGRAAEGGRGSLTRHLELELGNRHLSCNAGVHGMTKHSTLIIALAFFIGITVWVGHARSQQTPAPPAAPPPAGQRGAPGTENGIAVFQTQCMTCHGNPNVERAPSPAAIREMSPERIYEALTAGLMKDQGAKLSDQDRRGVA